MVKENRPAFLSMFFSLYSFPSFFCRPRLLLPVVADMHRRYECFESPYFLLETLGRTITPSFSSNLRNILEEKI